MIYCSGFYSVAPLGVSQGVIFTVIHTLRSDLGTCKHIFFIFWLSWKSLFFITNTWRRYGIPLHIWEFFTFSDLLCSQSPELNFGLSDNSATPSLRYHRLYLTNCRKLYRCDPLHNPFICSKFPQTIFFKEVTWQDCWFLKRGVVKTLIFAISSGSFHIIGIGAVEL